MSQRFDGKVVVISGSSSGIGQEAAIDFAKEGACVVVHGQNLERLKATENLLQEAGVPLQRILSVLGCLTKAGVAARIVAETIAKFGKIDVLVNNAGAGCKPREDGGKLVADSLENLDYLYQLNFRSAIEMTLLFLPHLEKTKGNVINVSSIGATKTFPSSTFYGCTKAAIDHFTRNYADKLGIKGIRINSLNPGAIKTNIIDRCEISNGQAKFEKFAIKHTSLGRIGYVSEVSPIILFLASDQASYVTGSCWVVDGGMLVRASTPVSAKDLLENGN